MTDHLPLLVGVLLLLSGWRHRAVRPDGPILLAIGTIPVAASVAQAIRPTAIVEMVMWGAMVAAGLPLLLLALFSKRDGDARAMYLFYGIACLSPALLLAAFFLMTLYFGE